MRKRSPVCACWRMTFFIIVCRRASPCEKQTDWRLKKIANQHPGKKKNWQASSAIGTSVESPVCCSTQRPPGARDLMADKQRRLPLLPAPKIICLKSPALRNAGRISVMMSIASSMGSALHLPKTVLDTMTVLFVTQNGYGATRVRFCNCSVGTLVGLVIAGVTPHLLHSSKALRWRSCCTNAGKLSDYS